MDQNPSATAKTVLDIVNTNTGMNFDTDGIPRPIEYMHNLGINMQREIFAVYENRKTSDDLIPADIQFIRHVDENEDDGIRKEKFIHEFQDFWICGEPTELREMDGQKNFLTICSAII